MITVLVAEDDLVAAGAEVLRTLHREPVDLLLLDLYLPDAHGLDICRAVRAAGHAVDVIAVTSARDLAVVRAAVSVGVLQSLLKPFTFATMRDKLERYARFLAGVDRTGEAADQDEVDSLLATLRSPEGATLPKGMSRPTLDAVVAALRAAGDGLSAGV